MGIFKKANLTKYVHLWKNSNTTTNYNSQTLNIDWSNYDYLIADCVYSTNNSLRLTCKILCINNRNTQLFYINDGTTDKFSREFKPTSNGLVISIGKKSGTEDNSYIIPVDIYGVKIGG